MGPKRSRHHVLKTLVARQDNALQIISELIKYPDNKQLTFVIRLYFDDEYIF